MHQKPLVNQKKLFFPTRIMKQ